METTTKRRPQWLLDLGLTVDTGRRPWLLMILAGPLMVLAVIFFPAVVDLAGSRAGPPGLERVVDAFLAATIVIAFIVFLLGIVCYFVCLYAHEAWLSLPVEERLEMARAHLERMDEFLEDLDRSLERDGIGGVRVRRRVWRRV